MIALSAHTKVYLAKDATDMRKSFRGLILLTEAVLQQESVSGHLFVFLNRRRDLMKILYWDGTGFCIWYKRLEAGVFKLPKMEAGASSVELRASELAMVLDGIDMSRLKRVPRYERAAPRISA